MKTSLWSTIFLFVYFLVNVMIRASGQDKTKMHHESHERECGPAQVLELNYNRNELVGLPNRHRSPNITIYFFHISFISNIKALYTFN